MSDDIDFRQAMKGVRRLKKAQVEPHTPPRDSDRALRDQIRSRARVSNRLQADEHASEPSPSLPGQANEAHESSLYYLRHGVQKKVLRDLKRGSRYRFGLSLDLHGLNRSGAQRAIDEAIDEALATRVACLLIIHGKGLRSRGEAALKQLAANHLQTRPEVRAYCSAQPRDGGTGALYVLLS